jgi:3'(2'),5'-bisphosphate nucleotidase
MTGTTDGRDRPEDQTALGQVALGRELAVAEQAARQAASVILGHYRAGPTPFESKADGSPVSAVDREADAAIAACLAGAFPDDAILSEETPDRPERLAQRRVWIVDPLDGTRGFLARTDDFCVHVALAIDGVPAVGVVHRPVSGVAYRAVAGQGAYRVEGGVATRLRVSAVAALPELRLGISRHNAPAMLLAWLDAQGLSGRALRSGASIKYTALAEGALDGVVTITRGEKEWDTCAPELIVREAGGLVTDGDGRPLAYNQADVDRPRGVVASNGVSHQALLAAVAPLL